VLPIYIHDDVNSGAWKPGAASRCWLHHSLHALNKSLDNRLLVLHGDPLQLLPALVQAHDIQQVCWNRCYEPWQIKRDSKLKQQLQAMSLEVHSFNAGLLWEPWQVSKADGSPYKVFTPYYRRGCKAAAPPDAPLPAPAALSLTQLESGQGGPAIDRLPLLPAHPWHAQLSQHWSVGEQAAQARLEGFLGERLKGYREGRDFPARQQVSGLSPHLHFGEISPRLIWHRATIAALEQRVESDLDCFLSELAWREFSYYQLYHDPQLPEQNVKSKFDGFPWLEDRSALQQWQRGETGYPLIDAGMRELWQTGSMHNRVRMVVASFLIKNLGQHWRHGADWFWDTLADADLASNSASWQWVAGSGADAAPYFRIFNPVTQSQRFDPDGSYIRRFVPELAALPDRHLHDPAAAPAAVLKQAGIRLGEHYPEPIVDLRSSRERALAAFKAL